MNVERVLDKARSTPISKRVPLYGGDSIIALTAFTWCGIYDIAKGTKGIVTHVYNKNLIRVLWNGKRLDFVGFVDDIQGNTIGKLIKRRVK